MKRQFASGIFGRRAGKSENFGITSGTQFGRKIGQRFDQDTSPSGLLQQPCLRAFARIVGADFDKIAFDTAKECSDQPHLMIGDLASQERFFHRDERVFDARVRSTIDVVEWPGTTSIKTISPPS